MPAMGGENGTSTLGASKLGCVIALAVPQMAGPIGEGWRASERQRGSLVGWTPLAVSVGRDSSDQRDCLEEPR